MTKLIRAAFFVTRASAVLITVALLCTAVSAQNPAPAKELLDWVAESRKAGLSEQQIQARAAVAGWQESAVNEALRETAADAPAAQDAKAKPAADADAKPAPPSKDVAMNAGTAAPPAGGANTGKAAGTAAPAAPADPAAKPPSESAPLPSAPTPANAGGDAGVPKSVMDRGVPDDYQIGAGDGLHIAVWHEPDATVPSALVRPDGKISMPLLKEVYVLGLTPSQLEKQLTQELTKFFTEPDVTVIVTSINSKKVYLIGAVKREGPIPFTYRMSILQALSEAGGLTDYAKRKKIYVLRTENGREFRLPFDYDAALKGQHMELNIPLMAGDTIVVPH